MKFFKLFLALSFAIFSNANVRANSTSEQILNVIFENGWVISFLPDNASVALKTRKLGLPKDTFIHSVSTDYAFDRLYVTIDSSYEVRGTYVYILSNLQQIGFMPGVSKVVIPIDPFKSTLITYSYSVLFADRRVNLSVNDIIYVGPSSTKVEVRSRSSFAKIFKDRSPDSPDALYQCGFSKEQGYPAERREWHINSELTLQKVTNFTTPSGWRSGCWENGDLYYTQDKGEGPAQVGRWSKRTRSMVTLDLPTNIEEVLGRDTVPLGTTGRFAAYISRRSDTNFVFDFEAKKIVNLSSVDSLYLTPVGMSRSREFWYLGNIYYQYRGNISQRYDDIPGGGRHLDWKLSRINVKGTPKIEAINLPASVLDIVNNDSAALIENMLLNVTGASQEELNIEIDRIKDIEPTALGKKIGPVRIIAVFQ